MQPFIVVLRSVSAIRYGNHLFFLALSTADAQLSIRGSRGAAAATMADGTRHEEGSEMTKLLKKMEFWHSLNRTKEAFAFYEVAAEDRETSE